MNQEKMTALIRETPELMTIILSDNLTKEEFTWIFRAAYQTPYFWETEGKMLNRCMDWINKYLKKVQTTEDALSMVHVLFDSLTELCATGFERTLKKGFSDWHTGMLLNSIISAYFQLLKSYETSCIEEQKTDKYTAFAMHLKQRMNDLQSLFKDVLTEGTRRYFTLFEEELIKKGQQMEKGIVVRQTKKLPPLSKLNKGGYLGLLKEMNLYSFDDASKLIEIFLKKYKFDDLPFDDAFKNKLMIRKGYGKATSDENKIDVLSLLKETNIYPMYPYFPYEEKNPEDFAKALKEDITTFTESPLRNMVLLKLISLHAEGQGLSFALNDSEEKTVEKMIETILQACGKALQYEERKELVSVGNVDVSKSLWEPILIGDEKLKIEEAYSVIQPLLRKRYSHKKNQISQIALPLFDERKEYGYVNTQEIQINSNLYLKRANPKAYQLLLQRYAKNFSLVEVIGKSTKYIYKNDFFEDVAIYQIKKGLISEKDARVLMGIDYVNYSEYESHYRNKLKKVGDELQEALLNVLLRHADEQRKMDFYQWNRALQSSSLTIKNQVRYIFSVKPNLMANILRFKNRHEEEAEYLLGDYIASLSEEQSEEIMDYIYGRS